MKIIIVGGTSSIAIALKPVLLANNEVLTAGRNDCDIQLDLNAPPKEINFPEADVVIHTAAHFGGKGQDDILNAESVNVLGTIKVCNAAITAKAKHLVVISSIFATLPKTAKQYNIYALSKKHAEEVAELSCAASALTLTILRPSQIYGIGDSFTRHQPFLYNMISKAERNEDIELYGSNDAKRNFMYMDDLVQIIVKVIEYKTEGSYNCTHPSNVTYTQIARAALAAFNSSASVRFLSNKPNIPDNIFPFDDTLYEKINYYPQISIEQGIENIKFHRQSL